jgi:integrase
MRDGRRNKKYRAVVTLDADPVTGKRRRMTVGIYRTASEAADALAAWKKDPYDTDVKNLTFGGTIDLWREEHFKAIAENSAYTEKYVIRKFAPLYHRPIRDIKLIDVQKMFDDMDLAPNTKAYYKGIFCSIYNYAEKYGFVDRNFCHLIETGKKVGVREHRIFSPQEISILWRSRLVPLVDTVLILIYTGMRINELLKLKKCDVNLKERYIIGGSKTDAGRDRLIPIHRDLVPLFKGLMRTEGETLVTTRTGKQRGIHSYRVKFHKLMASLGIEHHYVHDTRHTFASLINDSGANGTSIRKIIGHVSFEQMTEKVYTHKTIVELQAAVDMIEIKEA